MDEAALYEALKVVGLPAQRWMCARSSHRPDTPLFTLDNCVCTRTSEPALSERATQQPGSGAKGARGAEGLRLGPPAARAPGRPRLSERSDIGRRLPADVCHYVTLDGAIYGAAGDVWGEARGAS